MNNKKNYIYGKNCVRERLLRDPGSIIEVVLSEAFDDERILPLLAKAKTVRTVAVPAFKRLNPFSAAQGIFAEVKPFEYSDFDGLLDEAAGKRRVLLFLDRVADPNNLGALLRTAAGLGGFAVIIPRYKACPVTPAVLHVAQGADNYIPVAVVPNIRTSLLAAKKKGIWVVGALVDRRARESTSFSFPFPMALVLGSEENGIRYGIDKHLDFSVRIPMEGAEISFNVATAGAMLCYEIARQRRKIK